ncbi:hypothetical protein UC3_00743 [Enterococcus phoeniculicola ATCC BAA-412]|uniref:Uncharacterized protein n=1 Tax=Enterococcus phoeniculicola ATCC BAA-412 TaxID=1158610 RepID=R3TZL9_9ENTE|nr:hypothetical protein UC3_00743 [Enterococcus phoeniculicola ATCC BAA-412]EOT77216.1 hypothetical protein I589_02178 [Enterococcus phoeniculicola ATCC BAA-412]
MKKFPCYFLFARISNENLTYEMLFLFYQVNKLLEEVE